MDFSCYVVVGLLHPHTEAIDRCFGRMHSLSHGLEGSMPVIKVVHVVRTLAAFKYCNGSRSVVPGCREQAPSPNSDKLFLHAEVMRMSPRLFVVDPFSRRAFHPFYDRQSRVW